MNDEEEPSVLGAGCFSPDVPTRADMIDVIVTQAIARVLYERETGRDWHRAPRDPGHDPRWLARADDQRPPATKI